MKKRIRIGLDPRRLMNERVKIVSERTKPDDFGPRNGLQPAGQIIWRIVSGLRRN